MSLVLALAACSGSEPSQEPRHLPETSPAPQEQAAAPGLAQAALVFPRWQVELDESRPVSIPLPPDYQLHHTWSFDEPPRVVLLTTHDEDGPPLLHVFDPSTREVATTSVGPVDVEDIGADGALFVRRISDGRFVARRLWGQGRTRVPNAGRALEWTPQGIVHEHEGQMWLVPPSGEARPLVRGLEVVAKDEGALVVMRAVDAPGSRTSWSPSIQAARSATLWRSLRSGKHS